MKRLLFIRSALLTSLLLSTLIALMHFFPERLPGFSASAQQSSIAVVNAASFANNGTIAPDEIASIFGAFRTQNDQLFVATTLPLPTTLGGVRVTVNGVSAQLFFTSNTQINFIIPSAVALGPTSVVVTNVDQTTRSGTVIIAQASPGVFTAKSNGQGAAAAQTTNDGINYLSTSNPDGSERDVDAGTRARPNYLVLYATGLRRAPAANPTDGNGVAEVVTATIQGVPATVIYAGTQPSFAGLDQINLIIPPALAGFGSVRVQITVAGQAANPVTLKLGGEKTLVSSQLIATGETLSGALTVDDQVQGLDDGSGRTYFYDAYRFTAAADTTLAIDLRSTQFDAQVILYRLGSNSALNLIASDDQTGGLSAGGVVNNNALLLAVVPEAGDYVILVTSSDLEPDGVGNYTLALKTNVVQPISYNTTLAGADVVATDIQTSAGAYLKAYWFAGTQGDNVELTARSLTFDSYLILSSNRGELLGFNDNSGGGTNGQDAQITKVLPETGRYIIITTPLESNRTGGFSLSVRRI